MNAVFSALGDDPAEQRIVAAITAMEQERIEHDRAERAPIGNEAQQQPRLKESCFVNLADHRGLADAHSAKIPDPLSQLGEVGAAIVGAQRAQGRLVGVLFDSLTIDLITL